jgi:glycosyltransferase involved in cell wall biosynthesis
LPEGHVLFLQAREATRSDLGYGSDDPALSGKLVVSSKPLSVSEYDQFVRDATVGLAWYESDEDNIHYVGLSSGKVAHFFRWGKPVILNRLPLFNEIYEKYQCGILVDKADEIPAALEKIDQDYERYAAGARSAYSELFDMKKYAKELAKQIEQIAAPEKSKH